MTEPSFDNWIENWIAAQDYGAGDLVSTAANIRFGTNPAYNKTDFFGMFPQFGPSAVTANNATTYTYATGETGNNANNSTYSSIVDVYIALASASLIQLRWQDSWKFGMGLFVAHYMSLWLQCYSDPGSAAKTVAAQGQARGIQASKSVGDVSVSYQAVVGNWEEWGAWNLTLYGQQLMAIADIVGRGGMYIW